LDFATDIVNTIRNMDPPGRFLELDEEKDRWKDASLERVINVTCQALLSNGSDVELTHAYDSGLDVNTPWALEVVARADRPPADSKYPMISPAGIRLPNQEALQSLCLPDPSVPGPPRLPCEEGPVILTPHIHDVLFGRGPGLGAHQANTRYRRIIWENREQYAGMPR
jgi:hypothetical protein